MTGTETKKEEKTESKSEASAKKETTPKTVRGFAGWFRIEFNDEAREAINKSLGKDGSANRKDIRDFIEKQVSDLGKGCEAEVTTGTVEKAEKAA